MRKIVKLVGICLVLSASLVAVRNTYSQSAFAVPVSDQIVRGEIVLPGGKKIKFGAREGTMVTIRDLNKGYFIGIVPKIEDESTGEVTFRFFNIAEGVADGEVFQGVYQILQATKVGRPGSVHPVTTEHGDFNLKFTEIVLGEFPDIRLLDPRTAKPLELERLYGVTNGGLCCLGCGGITVCGGEVAGECGSCSGGGGARAV